MKESSCSAEHTGIFTAIPRSDARHGSSLAFSDKSDANWVRSYLEEYPKSAKLDFTSLQNKNDESNTLVGCWKMDQNEYQKRSEHHGSILLHEV